MALELQILSPKPGQKFPTIKWNNEQLKAEVAAAVADYQNLVVTVDTEKDCKETRAKLNKLRTAIEDARKDMKRRITEPLKIFEDQVKEVEAPIDSAIQNLDTQLAEVKQIKQDQKRKDIREAYEKGEAPEWLKLEQIWDDRWLNVSFPMTDVIKAIDQTISHINSNLEVIANLPEFAFEAEELYKQTLDFKGAIEQAKQMSIIQKRKAAAEAANSLPESPQNEGEEKPSVTDTKDVHVERTEQPLNATEDVSLKKYSFTFETTITAQQAKALGDFCRENGIKLIRIK